MSSVEINLEAVLIREVAAQLLAKMSPEERESILKSAIVSKLVNIDSWEMKKAIEAETTRLAAEYIKEPDIQVKLRETAIAKVNELINGLFDTFGKNMEDWAKSEWRRILKTKERS